MSQFLIVECLICGVFVEWKSDNKYCFFCFDCCKLIDFGVWVVEEYVIFGDILEDDIFFVDLLFCEY